MTGPRWSEFRLAVALALTIPWAGPPPAAAEEPAIAPGTSRKILLAQRAGGFRRSFRLHVPAKAGDGAPRPLVLALHGGVANAAILERQTGLSELADRHGFYVAYPNGLGVFGLFRHWNGGFCCAKALKSGLDDPGFVDRVSEWVSERYPVDPRRIYVIGYSNGGFLAYWYAAERADRLAGLGIWASSIGSLENGERTWSWPRPTAPLPVFVAHGRDDPKLPYDIPGARDGQRLLGAVGSAQAWVEANGCREPATVTRSPSGDPRSPDGAVERRTWCGESPAPVKLLALTDWGHDWPGPKLTLKLPAEQPLHGFHLAEEMWSFFSRLSPAGDP